MVVIVMSVLAQPYFKKLRKTYNVHTPDPPIISTKFELESTVKLKTQWFAVWNVVNGNFPLMKIKMV